MSSLPAWVFFLIPPLLGAVIGYVTNALAIRMLFRPLTRKYFLGIPLPLTPGIIPRQRIKLAHSIARMVSRSLFNADVILTHIRGKGFQAALKLQLEQLFYPAWSSKESESPSVSPVLRQLGDLIAPALGSAEVQRIIMNLLGRMGKNLSSKTIGEFLPEKIQNETELAAMLEDQIRRKGFRRLKWALIRRVQYHSRRNSPLQRFITPLFLRRTVYVIDRFYPPLVNFIMDFLRRPETRKELVRRGKSILSDILMRLNPVQRIVLSAGQYDKTLEENMPAIITDLLRTLESTLRNSANREKLITALHEFLGKLQEKGVGDLETEYGLDLPRGLYRLLSSLQSLLISEEAPGRVARYFVEHSSGEHASGIGELLESWAGMNLEEFLTRIGELFFSWLGMEENRVRFGEQLSVLFRSAGGIHVKLTNALESNSDPEFAEVAEERGDRGFIDVLRGGLSVMIEGAVPALVERFDIYQMVVDRINSLDIKEVEELLLGIIARHLKFINIFGAILGAMIGGAQLVLQLIS